jgi:thiamine biosynthesis lipoprotein ApbE
MIDGGASSSYGLNKNPNPDRDYWLVGISSPYKNILSTPSIATLKFENTYTLSVSGDYEQSFHFYDENNNKVLRHHILNPFTGYPENYQRVVSVKSDSRSDVLDALTTAIFSIESIDKITKIIENIEQFYSIDIDFFIEREIDSVNKKVDIYLDEGFKSYVQEYNLKYMNNEYVIKKGDEQNEEKNI